MYACNALSQICPVFYPDNPVYIIIYFQEIRSFMFKWGSYKCQSSPVPSNLNKFNCFGVAWFKSNSSPSRNILKCKKCMNSNSNLMNVLRSRSQTTDWVQYQKIYQKQHLTAWMNEMVIKFPSNLTSLMPKAAALSNWRYLFTSTKW